MSATTVSQASVPTVLPPAAFARIEKFMATWRAELAQSMCDADAFRYEMFSRRLVAAEYERADAVAWAWTWYEQLLAEDLEAARLVDRKIADRESLRRQTRQEIALGRSSNPRFQAFLDTLEDPEAEMYNADGSFQGWKYLVWIGGLMGNFERRRDLPDSEEERQALFTEAVQDASRRQRATRI